jgi:L-malate glycosyltransferase
VKVKGETLHCLHVASGDLWAGAEAQLYQLVRQLKHSTKIRSSVILMNDGELASRLRAEAVDVIVLDEKRMGPIRLLVEVWRVVREREVDIVHTHRVKENIIGTLAARLAGRRSVRTVHGRNEHPARGLGLRHRILETADWLGGCLQDRVIAVSEVLGKEIERDWGANRVMTIANGVDVDAIAASRETRALDERPFEVVMAGRLAPVKRIDLAISVAARLEKEEPGRFRLHIYGEGPLRHELLCEVERLKLPPEIVRFEGFQPDLLPRIARHDALLITSDHEGLPMILLEMLALGKPVVARSVGEIPNVLDDPLSDWCIDSDRPEAFAQLLIELRNAISEGRTDVSVMHERARRYDIAVCAALHEALYCDLVSGSEGH